MLFKGKRHRVLCIFSPFCQHSFPYYHHENVSCVKNSWLFHWNCWTLVQKGFSFWDSLNLTWANSRKEQKGRYSDSTKNKSHITCITPPLLWSVKHFLQISWTCLLQQLPATLQAALNKLERETPELILDCIRFLWYLCTLRLNTHIHTHAHTK